MYNTNLQKQVLEKFPNWKEFKNKTLRKGMKSLASEGSGNMSMDRVIQFKQLTSEFVSAFGQATVCRYNDSSDCNATLEGIV